MIKIKLLNIIIEENQLFDLVDQVFRWADINVVKPSDDAKAWVPVLVIHEGQVKPAMWHGDSMNFKFYGDWEQIRPVRYWSHFPKCPEGIEDNE